MSAARTSPSRVTSLDVYARRVRRPVYVAMVAVLAIATFALAMVAIALVATSGTIASWWPGAGTVVALYLVYRGPTWHVVVFASLVGLAANAIFERDLTFMLVAATALAAEVLVFGLLIGQRSETALLSTVQGFVRFLGASFGAALATGVLAGVGFWLFSGADLWWTVFSLSVSHVSAILLFVPAFLVPLPQRSEIQSWEWSVVAITLAIATLLIFAPFQRLPISALVLPLLGLAALRFSPIYSTTALVVVGALASLLTLAGGGPYVAESGVALPAVILQVFFISISVTVTLIAVVSTERRALLVESAERAALLHGGFVGSQVGTIFAQRSAEGAVTTLDANDIALDMVDEATIERLLVTSEVGEVREFTNDRGRTLQVFVDRVKLAGMRRLYALQLVDVTELVEARRTIERAMQREREVADGLRALAQEKDDLVAAVSHELRTPITSVLGFAEELSEARDDAEREQYISIIARNATRLSRMVDNLLEHGRGSAPGEAIPTRPIVIDDALRDAAVDVSSIARAGSVTLSTTLGTRGAIVMADPAMLTSVLSNVLSNAAKYTPPEGSVEVSSALEGEEIVVTVDDSGPGISEAERDRVFDPFYRAAATRESHVAGTGLGLSITRRLVDRLGGSITIGDSRLGGAQVTVRLPRARVALATDRADRAPASVD